MRLMRCVPVLAVVHVARFDSQGGFDPFVGPASQVMVLSRARSRVASTRKTNSKRNKQLKFLNNEYNSSYFDS